MYNVLGCIYSLTSLGRAGPPFAFLKSTQRCDIMSVRFQVCFFSHTPHLEVVMLNWPRLWAARVERVHLYLDASCILLSTRSDLPTLAVPLHQSSAAALFCTISTMSPGRLTDRIWERPDKLTYDGGSTTGTKCSAMYARPMNPTIDPQTYSMV